jgi:hypothetical protein
LFAEIDEQNKNLPLLSDAEIAAEIDAAREEMKSKRAKFVQRTQLFRLSTSSLK